jgi:hypothetical protein
MSTSGGSNFGRPQREIKLISTKHCLEVLSRVSEINLIRTDTTLDLNQKTEKVTTYECRCDLKVREELGLRGGWFSIWFSLVVVYYKSKVRVKESI